MTIKLNDLRDNNGARKGRMRVGRGIGSGKGKTGGRGQKGQKSRSGVSINGFEGGQMPLHMRIPKRGFNNIFAPKVAEVNLRDLNRFAAGSVVDAQALAEAGLVKGAFDAIKLLGQGNLDRALTIKVDRVSAGAKAKVEAAGGTVELI